jgi:hypothetical protein
MILIHTVPREFNINPQVTFMEKIKLPYLSTLHLESQQRSIKKIFWRRCRGTSRRIAYKKVFITNLCKCLSLGRLHLSEYHLILLDFQSTLFLFCYCLAYHFIFCFAYFYILVCILFFILHFLLLFILVALVVASFYF